MMAFDDYEITSRPMTSDEVFASLVDFQRDELGIQLLGEATRETPVRELFNTFEAGTWADVANGLNRLFDLHVSHAYWQPILLPKRKRMLGGLCDFIAERATVPIIQPVTVMGDSSLAAGAFLAVRRIFADAGADVSELRPSSLVSPYFRTSLDTVLPRLMRAAPGCIPIPRVEVPVHSAFGWGFAASWFIVMCGGWLHCPPAARVMGGIGMAACSAAAWICGRAVKPRAVHFGTARTFADLARVIAGERCAWPGFPVVIR
jgi:hypothetical protein